MAKPFIASNLALYFFSSELRYLHFFFVGLFAPELVKAPT
jgi:hypothetical protein